MDIQIKTGNDKENVDVRFAQADKSEMMGTFYGMKFVFQDGKFVRTLLENNVLRESDEPYYFSTDKEYNAKLLMDQEYREYDKTTYLYKKGLVTHSIYPQTFERSLEAISNRGVDVLEEFVKSSFDSMDKGIEQISIRYSNNGKLLGGKSMRKDVQKL